MTSLTLSSGLCQVPYVFHNIIGECNAPYSYEYEDQASYDVGWSRPSTEANATSSTAESPPPAEYTYITGSALDSYPFLGTISTYGGGGYVVRLVGDENAILDAIDRLQSGGWIDRYTRAVFIEFAVYNPNANLFVGATMVAEMMNSGGFTTYYRFEPMNLLGTLDGLALFQLAIQILFVVFIVFFVIKEFRNFWKQRRTYFSEYWNWVELAIIVLSLVVVVMYVYRYLMVDKLLKIFEETAGNGYMKFQMVAYWNEQMLYGIGLLVFLSNLKFLRILRFNKIMGLLGSTLKYASKSLISFALVFFIVFIAFNQFFYLTFMSYNVNFSTMLQTVEQCLQMLVGKFNFSTFITFSPILGTTMFFLYMVLCFFVMITMFMAIMDEAFTTVREDLSRQTNEFELVDFCVERFLRWSGLSAVFKKKKENAVHDESLMLPYDDGLGNLVENIELFPQRLDRLLDAISQTYFYGDCFESVIHGNEKSSKNTMTQMKKENNIPTGENGVSWNQKRAGLWK